MTTKPKATSNQIAPGMTISIKNKIYRVESSVKVTVARGTPFIKTKLKDLMTDDVIEKNFKLDQEIEEANLTPRRLEYLYLEGKNHVFLDVDDLSRVSVPSDVIGDKIDYLKEGTQIKAMLYGELIFSIELPQFLELMVIKTEDLDATGIEAKAMSNAMKTGQLETGARIQVPIFIEAGDIIKVDTHSGEYIQRV